jgi:aspartyl-tRNA(Asn)/glutamyl-tRNA(Gln) amidotransferase subunit C
MIIDQKTIEHIAKLARLKVNPEDAAEYGEQLTKVLTHFQQISNLDTTNIEPLVTPVEIEFFAREDVVKQENTTEEMLQNAPDKAGNLFKVPPVV